MSSYRVRILLLVALSISAGISEAVLESVVAAAATGDFGHGFQVVGKLVRQFINSQPEDVRLGDGVHLINVRSENDARAAPSDDGTMLGAVEGYLQTHELRIRLPELMPGEGFGRAFKHTMAGIQDTEIGTPRRKGGKGGFGGIALIGLMMGKMMAALGLGGVGLLAMKALMVSALALMLSMIIGLKKLVSSDQDDSGGGHTVIHASHGSGHEHRRKRNAADMAYHAWKDYQTS